MRTPPTMPRLKGLRFPREINSHNVWAYHRFSLKLSCTGGFTLRKVFYTVPSRLIGHRLCVRLFDDRLDVFTGGTHLLTLPEGRAKWKSEKHLECQAGLNCGIGKAFRPSTRAAPFRVSGLVRIRPDRQ